MSLLIKINYVFKRVARENDCNAGYVHNGRYEKDGKKSLCEETAGGVAHAVDSSMQCALF